MLIRWVFCLVNIGIFERTLWVGNNKSHILLRHVSKKSFTLIDKCFLWKYIYTKYFAHCSVLAGEKRCSAYINKEQLSCEREWQQRHRAETAIHLFVWLLLSWLAISSETGPDDLKWKAAVCWEKLSFFFLFSFLSF